MLHPPSFLLTCYGWCHPSNVGQNESTGDFMQQASTLEKSLNVTNGDSTKCFLIVKNIVATSTLRYNHKSRWFCWPNKYLLPASVVASFFLVWLRACWRWTEGFFCSSGNSGCLGPTRMQTHITYWIANHKLSINGHNLDALPWKHIELIIKIESQICKLPNFTLFPMGSLQWWRWKTFSIFCLC